jgi:hypothetical protein
VAQSLAMVWIGFAARQSKSPMANSGVDVIIIIFGDFCQFSEKKLAFFSKPNVMIIFFQKLAVV